MKKYLLTTALLLSVASGAFAQTLLDEGFETGNTGSALTPVAAGEGWTVVNGYTGTKATYNWHNYYANPEGESGGTITGACCAAVDAPFSVASSLDGIGPREETLLTPELDLNDTYRLQFTFIVSPVNCQEGSKYDIQVRVVTDDNLAGAETIFSIQNEKMLRESGIMDFPINSWSPHTAQVDLSDFKGEKVKLAFVYKMLGETANVVWLDDVSVKKFTPAAGPVASLSMDRYTYPSMYIGEKMYSEVITLTNTGKDGLTVSSIDLPAGCTVSPDLTAISLDRYKTVDFQIAYTASLTSAASGNVVLHTNGGDATVAIAASKQFVPEGSLLETFESYNPPAGWNNNGWTWTNVAMEGDRSMNCSGGFGASSLRSPLLDLNDGGTLTFTYYNQYDSEYEGELPYYDIELQVSYDGGDNWTTKWKSDDQHLNQLYTVSVDLGYGSDNSYVRWYYPQVEIDDEGAMPHSSFTLDRVILPNVYGAGGRPLGAKVVSPVNGATDIYPEDVKLEWSPAQFAEGYKVYVGTNTAANDLVDGVDVGTALSYTVPKCAYSTTYRWKVVPYNSEGNGTSSTWRFTTQADATVSEYPYEQDFLTSGTPEGWTQTPSANYSRTWYVNSSYPYVLDGKEYGAFATTWLQEGDSNAVTTQKFTLPEDKNMCITFTWGDEHPASLVVDPTGMVKKNNIAASERVSELCFDINVDGEWIMLSDLSENHFDGDRKYWINEKIELDAYKGKTVQFRWRHNSFSGRDEGGAITRIRLFENESSRGAFNISQWNAGKVNYEKATNSGDIFTLHNEGSATLKVESVAFNTPNFSCSLQPGDEIAVKEGKPFNLQFNALQSDAEVTDVMTITFEGGYTMEMPVSGTALPRGTYYYSFEPNALDYEWDKDFTMIDVDGGVNYSFSSYWVHYSADGLKGAFSVESDSKEDGMYGMMAPISGMYALVASSPQNAAADNWIISKKMKATNTSRFEFYGRNWETLQSVLPDPKHNVTVLVSTVGNADTKDFNVEMRKTEMPFLKVNEWNHYEVDLSKYAGQDVYVALQHTTTSASNLAFFDDFCFHNFDIENSGIDTVATDIADDAEVEVFSLSGIAVAKGLGKQTLSGLEKGFYIVKVTAADGSTRAFSIAR